MRPVSLEIEGFASFRKRADIKFEDCDLFVLTGPTGSGKSSVIDAITFALYGTIARLDDKGAVAPAINQGSLRARVRLAFDVGDHHYVLAREVPRKGATKVALERDGVPIAASVTDLKREIESILGLSFEQFTKCVVLPQGDFADFLHAGAKERQDLLVKLLDADLFRSIQKVASARASTLKSQVDTTDRDLERERDTIRVRAGRLLLEPADQFSDNGEDAFIVGGGVRVLGLGSLVDRLGAAVEEGQRLAGAAKTRSDEATRCREAASALAAVVTPSAVPGFQQHLDEAREGVRSADDALAAAEAAQNTAETALKALPAKTEATEVARLWESRSILQVRCNAAEGELRAAAERLKPLGPALESAGEAQQRARGERERLLHRNAAYAAAQGLAAGDPCPVCGEPLVAIPALPPPVGIDAVDLALASADEAFGAARRAVTDAEKGEAVARQKHDGAADALADAEAALDGKPSEDDSRATLTEIAAAEADVTKARAAFAAARVVRDAAQSALDHLSAETESAWNVFEERSRTCAALGTPPMRKPDDLAASWAALQAWASAEAAVYTAKAETEAAEAVRLDGDREALAAGQLADCSALGVTVGAGQQPLLAANTAHANGQRDLDDLCAAVAERRRLTAHRDKARRQWVAAESLTRHLRSDRFEQWYLEEALSRLLGGASTTLLELSSGQYSLQLDENRKDFLVVDHANADETRPVKTLSGGETFLASLSLALALADEIALLAPATAPRLEALFLDEGFGTLDADTLETVTAAIEELGARGRMVGIVTHVRELAERLPVRFKVTKVGGSSCIEREL